MGLAVAEGIGKACGVQAGIKWPNDIVVQGKKVCSPAYTSTTEPSSRSTRSRPSSLTPREIPRNYRVFVLKEDGAACLGEEE